MSNPQTESTIDVTNTSNEEAEKDFSEDEDGNPVPVVRVPLSDLMSESSSFLRDDSSRHVFRSKSSDTTTSDQTQQHSCHSLQEASSSWKTALPVLSWNNNNPSSTAGLKQQSSRPSTLDSESAQFAVSAIDAYNTGVTSQVTHHQKNMMNSRTESNPFISNGPGIGMNNQLD